MFLHTKPVLKRNLSKGKEFAPKGSKFFPFNADSFPEGRQKNFDKVLIESVPEITYLLCLTWKCISPLNC